jgi:hypothetical protein
MARGVTLAELVDQFRLECGMSTQPAQGTQTREHIKQMLRRVQETLFADFDWPFLHVFRTENLLPGENIYSWPDDLDVNDVRQLWDYYGATYYPLGYGISMQDRNAHDETSRCDPAMRWEIRDDRQYEIWPVPATARPCVIEAYLSLKPMVEENSRCTMDGTLLVLFAAAEWLARNKMPDAQAKLQAAQQFSRNLRKRSVSDKRRNVIPLLPGRTDAVIPDPTRRVYGQPPPIPR